MLRLRACAAAAALGLLQGAPLDATCEVTRVPPRRLDLRPAVPPLPWRRRAFDDRGWAAARHGTLPGDTLRLGTSFVPDADSLELRRVAPDARYPASVVEVVTAR